MSIRFRPPSRIRSFGRALVLLTILAPGAFSAAAATSGVAVAQASPPPISILSSWPNIGPGDIFITPTGDTSTYANGPEILDSHGNVIWFHADPARPDRVRLPHPDLPRSAAC